MVDPCIIVPVYQRELSSPEAASLRQMSAVLGHYPIYIVTHKDLELPAQFKSVKSQVVYFDQSYFKSIAGYNKLMLSKAFYQKFEKHTHMLIYQLDAWVFKDELVEWCEKPYDYIGAPWFSKWDRSDPSTDPFIGVGNGGFSLRRISTQLKVLRTFSYIRSPFALLNDFRSAPSIAAFVKLIKSLTITNNTYHLFNDYPYNEDVFWGMIASSKFHWFKVPSLEESLKFAFEIKPSMFYNDLGKLPFGCHAWMKYEPEFWSRFIKI